MDAVFRGHTVICGWNPRGKTIVESLLALGDRPVLIVNPDIKEIVRHVGQLEKVFVIAGDPTSLDVLRSADVESARSVIVLADESLVGSTDARSVQVALAVEKIQVSVYTVVELRDLVNKAHFSWTKVDDLIADEEIGVRMLAQGIRHVLSTQSGSQNDEKLLLRTYDQLVNPHHNKSQLFRIDLPWQVSRRMTFREILAAGMKHRVLPVALAGYRIHEIPARPGQAAWTSWKTDVQSNPPPHKRCEEIWTSWPEDEGSPLGVIVIARSKLSASNLEQALANQ